MLCVILSSDKDKLKTIPVKCQQSRKKILMHGLNITTPSTNNPLSVINKECIFLFFVKLDTVMTQSRLKCFITMHLYWFLQMVWNTLNFRLIERHGCLTVSLLIYKVVSRCASPGCVTCIVLLSKAFYSQIRVGPSTQEFKGALVVGHCFFFRSE